MAYNYEYPYVDPNRFNADWLINQMKELTAKMQELEEKVDAIDLTREEVVEMIAQCLKDAKAYTDLAIGEFFNNTVKPYVIDMISAEHDLLKAYIDSQDQAYLLVANNRMDSIALDLVDYIDSKVLSVNYMINPITGDYEEIPDVIDMIVNTFYRGDALTAAEYDGYALTANNYDSQLITAFDYDFNGRNAVTP